MKIKRVAEISKKKVKEYWSKPGSIELEYETFDGSIFDSSMFYSYQDISLEFGNDLTVAHKQLVFAAAVLLTNTFFRVPVFCEQMANPEYFISMYRMRSEVCVAVCTPVCGALGCCCDAVCTPYYNMTVACCGR